MEFKRSRSSSKIGLTNRQMNSPFTKYQLGQMLGQGQFGKVYKAYLKDGEAQYTSDNSYIKNLINNRSFNTTTNFKQFANQKKRAEKEYAAKIIPLGKLKKNPKLKQLLTNQIQILSTLKHENIIKFEQLFVYNDKIYMIYEYCQGGDLQDILPLNQDKALDVFSKIINACSFAEKNNVLHRDLKPANILFKNGEPKVADWGFSRYLKEQFTATSFVGSPAYMAPELLKGSQYTNKADVWSFGIMLYQSLFNQMPWPAKNIRELLQKLKITPLKFPKQIPLVFKTILNISLQVNPQKRASFKKLQKVMSLNIKGLKTQQQNPQDSTQLSPSDIRKCSYYLQFAKQAQKFEDLQAKTLCFQLILSNLKNIKKVNFENKNQKIHMSPCLSQRQISSISKREMIAQKTTSKTTKKQRNTHQGNQTYMLLDKQILLIQKIRQTFSSSGSLQSLCKAQCSLASHSTKSSQVPGDHKQTSRKLLIKKILKRLIKNISISQVPKSEIGNSNRNLSVSSKCKIGRRQLMQMNCILQIIMFEQLSEQAKNKKLTDKIQQMEQMGINSLLRSVNHKILYINQHYCK